MTRHGHDLSRVNMLCYYYQLNAAPSISHDAYKVAPRGLASYNDEWRAQSRQPYT